MPPSNAESAEHRTPCTELLLLAKQVEAVTEYQDKQNGHLARIDAWVTEAPTRADATRKELQSGIDTLKNWILATLATGLLGIIIAIVGFILKGAQP